MPTLVYPHFVTAAQEIPVWALIEHAASAAPTGIDGGFQQFCKVAKAAGRGRQQHCGRTRSAAAASEQKPCSSSQARAQQCPGEKALQNEDEGAINFHDFLNNASAIAQSFFGPQSGQGDNASAGATSTKTTDRVLSESISADNGFEVNLDVSQYAAEELNVKTLDNSIIIEAKHGEKKDGHGFVSRSFTRRYVLPEGVKVENVTCKLASNGVLTLSAPIVKPNNERVIPINFTGVPATVPEPTAPTVVAEPAQVSGQQETAPAETQVPVAMEEESKLD